MIKLFGFLSVVLGIYTVPVRAQSAGANYAVIISGGVDKYSNNQRYFENVHAMYDAFRSEGIASDHIMVLYGSGKVEDTNTGKDDPQFANVGGVGQYNQYGQYGGVYGQGMPTTPMTAAKPSGEDQKNSADPEVEGKACPNCTVGAKGTNVPAKNEPTTITLDYLFSGEKRDLNGGANSKTIKDKFRELESKLKPGDNVTLYITDHGAKNSDGGTSVVLWGEKMSVDELGDLLREFPSTNKIRVVTNICYGGGLTDLTSSNVCVMANQRGEKTGKSESIDLNLYGQNFPYALKKKIDTDKDGKATLWDAHQFAVNLDNPGNIPYTSINWFLDKNKNKILEESKKSGTQTTSCQVHPDDAIKQISSVLDDFERMRTKMSLSTAGIPSNRQGLLKGRLEKSVELLKNSDSSTIIDELSLKIQDLRLSIAESAKNWDHLPPDEQAAKRQQTQLDAQQIKAKLSQLEKDRLKYETTSLELDLLKYGDENLIKEYSSIRRCLEYAF